MSAADLAADPYALGLIWAVGQYDDTRQRYIVRCRERYTADYLQSVLGGTMLPSRSRTGEQYTLRINDFDYLYLTDLGWTARSADTRDVPVLDDYAPFLRGYFEMHCRPSFATSYTWGSKANKYYRPIIRVYGNAVLLTSVREILNRSCGSNIPVLQGTSAEKSKIITYGSADSMSAVYHYLDGKPCNAGYWDALYRHITGGTSDRYTKK